MENEVVVIAIAEIVKREESNHLNSRRRVTDTLETVMAWAEKEKFYLSTRTWINIIAKAYNVHGTEKAIADWIDNELAKGGGHTVGPWPGSQTLGRVSLACMYLRAGQPIPEQHS